jgi:hypothetical protein
MGLPLAQTKMMDQDTYPRNGDDLLSLPWRLRDWGVHGLLLLLLSFLLLQYLLQSLLSPLLGFLLAQDKAEREGEGCKWEDE